MVNKLDVFFLIPPFRVRGNNDNNNDNNINNKETFNLTSL